MYDLLRALGSAFCDIAHEAVGAICYRLWDLHLLISHTRPGVRCFRVLLLVISHTRQEVRFVTSIGFCVL